MPDLDTVRSWQGATMVDPDGDKIGTIESIYVDDQTGEPEWALVNTGLFGTKSSFVPLAQATPTGDQVQVPYQKQLVKDAPRIDPDQHLSESEEQHLWRHYGLEYGTTSGYEDRDGDGVYDDVQDAAVGRDTSGPTTDDAMTRSEEELRVGTETRERGRVRLRKYVTTEQVTQTVPVQREEVRVERQPITDANLDAATSGPDISEEEHEVTLREEEVVVEKRAVPKERVRLDTETVTDQRQISEEVHKEQIEVDGEGDQSTYRDDRL